MKKPSELFLIINEYVNFTAGIIGIFAFLTGMSSVPVLLSLKNESNVTWFSGEIPMGIAVPVFVIGSIGISTFYFLVLVKINVWLCGQGIVDSEEQSSVEDIFERPGDLVYLIFGVLTGCCIGYLATRSFFGEGSPALLFMFFYVVWLAWSGYQVGKQAFLLTDVRKDGAASRNVNWSIAIGRAKVGLGRMYSAKPETITIERWWRIRGKKTIGMHVILPERIVDEFMWTRHFVEVDEMGNVQQNFRITEV